MSPLGSMLRDLLRPEQVGHWSVVHWFSPQPKLLHSAGVLVILNPWHWLFGHQNPELPSIPFWERVVLAKDIRRMHHLVTTRKITKALAPDRESIS